MRPLDRPLALVLDDDPAWQQIVGEILADGGLWAETVASVEAALETISARPHRVAVLDLSLEGGSGAPDESGLVVLAALRRQDPGCVPILLTGYATVELAVSALTRYGAFTVLQKDTFRRSAFASVVRQALAVAPASPRVTAAATLAEQVPGAGGGVGPSRPAAFGGLPVLLVEDDAGWRSVLGQLLAEAGYTVRPCPSYGEALGYLRRERYALAVVDLSLASSIATAGNQDGYQVLAWARNAGLPAIVVSGTAEPAEVERAYAEQGIFAYLEKQAFDRRSFLSLVREAVGGAREGSGDLSGLTPRERDVLALLAQGLTNKEIAGALVVSPNTVKRYLKSVFAKLDVDTRAAAAARAIRAGITSDGGVR